MCPVVCAGVVDYKFIAVDNHLVLAVNTLTVPPPLFPFLCLPLTLSPTTSHTHTPTHTHTHTHTHTLHCVAAEVDVMICTAFVEFLFNLEILGCVDQCLCIFRLFPRPVVSLRPSTFMTTYQKIFWGRSRTPPPLTPTNLIRSQELLNVCVCYHLFTFMESILFF